MKAKMEVVQKPTRRKRRSNFAEPPPRTIFIREGTVVRYKGNYWRLRKESDFGGSWKVWDRVIRVTNFGEGPFHFYLDPEVVGDVDYA